MDDLTVKTSLVVHLLTGRVWWQHIRRGFPRDPDISNLKLINHIYSDSNHKIKFPIKTYPGAVVISWPKEVCGTINRPEAVL